MVVPMTRYIDIVLLIAFLGCLSCLSDASETGDTPPVLLVESPADSSKAAKVPSRQNALMEQPGRRVALLISVNEYYYGLKSLEYCNNDMERLEQTLRLAGYDKVIRMHPESKYPNRRGISVSDVKGVLDELLQSKPGGAANSSPNDLLLIAFSGHGIQKNGRRYLCPPGTLRDFKESQLTLLFEPDTELAPKAPGILNYVLEDFKGHCLLLIDACRNGAEEDEIKSQNETSLPRNERLHIFSSCKAGQVSYEEPGLEHGRFMYFVITGMAGGAGDENGVIDLQSLQHYVLRQMESYEKKPESKGRLQTPAVYTGGEFSGKMAVGHKNIFRAGENSNDIVSSFYETASLSPHSVTHTTYKPIDGRVNTQRGAMSEHRLRFRFPNDTEDREILSDIVQLPGLNGEWWFQEMPWYLPHARMAMAQILTRTGAVEEGHSSGNTGQAFLGRNPYAYLNTNTTEVKKLFWNYVSSGECGHYLNDDKIMEMIVELQRNSTTPMTREMQYGFFTRLDQDMEEAYRSKDRRSSPLDLYTRAVFRHQIALLSGPEDKKNDILVAEKFYEQTLKEFESILKGPDREVAKYFGLFYQLCLSDYCYFLVGVQYDYQRYSDCFKLLTESLKDTPNNTLFKIAIHTENAKQSADHRKLPEAAQGFREAANRIAGSRINKTAHPLEANYYERSGWYRMDFWRIVRAKNDFKSALLIREHNQWSSGNPIDLMYVTYGLHGRATISHFSGDDDSARKDFKTALEMLDGIRGSLSKEGQAFFKTRLDERQSSTLERLADISLYDNGNVQQKSEGLDLYEQGAVITNKSPTRIRLKSKKAMMHVRLKEYDKARECLSELEPAVLSAYQGLTETFVIPIFYFKAASIAADLMESVDKKDEIRFKADRERMRGFLDRFLLFSNSLSGIQRDTFELRLLCSDLLLDADLAMNLYEEADRDVDYLAKCLTFLSEREGMQMFLRRYFEKLISVKRMILMQSDDEVERQNTLRSIALGIQRMRNVSSIVNLESTGTANLVNARASASMKSGTPGDVPEGGENENAPNGPTIEPTIRTILEPTNNYLIDRTSVVVFYFPSEDGLPVADETLNQNLRNGLVLIVSDDGDKITSFDLQWDRNDVLRSRYLSESDGLSSETAEQSFFEVFQQIETESKKTSSFYSQGTDKLRQAVFISWSDEICWPENSKEAIAKKMFPRKLEELPRNVVVQ